MNEVALIAGITGQNDVHSDFLLHGVMSYMALSAAPSCLILTVRLPCNAAVEEMSIDVH